MTMHDGAEPVTLTGDDAIAHRALPGFHMIVAELFALALGSTR